MKRLKQPSVSEKLFIEEVMHASGKVRIATRGQGIGSLIKSIRVQLGMSQTAVAKRAGVPQSTVSRLEKGRDINLTTLNKILHAISCDLIIAPLLKDSIDNIRRKQARKIAEKEIRYLKGTMNLENQQPDPRFIGELLKQEEGYLLHGPNNRLWQD